MVTSFQYLERVILEADNDWPEVVRNWTAVVMNLSGARAVWKRMPIILSREGAEPWVSGIFFKAMVQEVLLFGVDT